jgi:hypothetical protein
MPSGYNSMPTELPVYQVSDFGIREGTAKRLTGTLDIPWDKIVFKNGGVSFHDPTHYLAVPTAAVDDPEVVASLVEDTKNPTPETPLEIRGINYEALARMSPLPPEDALEKAAAAFSPSDSSRLNLIRHSATPVVGHTIFKTVSTTRKKGVPESTTTKLDTHVSYRYTLDGYPLIGPGAQTQVNFSPEGNVTRLVHSTRGLAKGPQVKLIPTDEIRSKFARSLPDDAEVNIRLV